MNQETAKKEFSLPLKKEEVRKEENKPSYRNIRGQKIFKADGSLMKEVDKTITPKDAEELDLCDYFASKGNLQKLS